MVPASFVLPQKVPAGHKNGSGGFHNCVFVDISWRLHKCTWGFLQIPDHTKEEASRSFK